MLEDSVPPWKWPIDADSVAGRLKVSLCDKGCLPNDLFCSTEEPIIMKSAHLFGPLHGTSIDGDCSLNGLLYTRLALVPKASSRLLVIAQYSCCIP